MPTFTSWRSASRSKIGGLKIQSGDLLHGDLHGVQSIPLDIAARIPPVAARIAAQETGADRALPVAGILARKTAARAVSERNRRT